MYPAFNARSSVLVVAICTRLVSLSYERWETILIVRYVRISLINDLCSLFSLSTCSCYLFLSKYGRWVTIVIVIVRYIAPKLN